jgi:hypothetical protein
VSPAGVRARAVEFFVEPRELPPPPPTPLATTSPASPLWPPPPAPAIPDPSSGGGSGRALHGAPLVAVPRASLRAATRFPLRAAVLGASAEAQPVAAMLANALRAAAGASTAAVAVWAPGSGAPARGGPASFAASRLAGRLTARGLPAVGRGRLAWLPLDDHPVAATVAARRAAGALEVPLVVVLAGPRCEVVEGLLGEQDLVLVVTGDVDGPLARLAVESCTGAALAHRPCAPGPVRLRALAGLAGARGLAVPVRAVVRELATPPEAAG